MLIAVEQVRDKAMRIAADVLEVSPDDIEIQSTASFGVKGAPEKRDHAAPRSPAAAYGGNVPDGDEPGLEATRFFNAGRLDLPVRRPHRGGRDRPGDRQGHAPTFVAVDDCRHRDQPAAAGRPAPRRHRPGRRPRRSARRSSTTRTASC